MYKFAVSKDSYVIITCDFDWSEFDRNLQNHLRIMSWIRALRYAIFTKIETVSRVYYSVNIRLIYLVIYLI